MFFRYWCARRIYFSVYFGTVALDLFTRDLDSIVTKKCFS